MSDFSVCLTNIVIELGQAYCKQNVIPSQSNTGICHPTYTHMNVHHHRLPGWLPSCPVPIPSPTTIPALSPHDRCTFALCHFVLTLCKRLHRKLSKCAISWVKWLTSAMDHMHIVMRGAAGSRQSELQLEFKLKLNKHGINAKSFCFRRHYGYIL